MLKKVIIMKNKTKKVGRLLWIKGDERELNPGVKCDWIMNENKSIKFGRTQEL